MNTSAAARPVPGTDAAADPVAAVSALDEPTRRRLYEHVSRQASAVSRDEAAEALGIARSTAAFHLDRLAERGLLDVTFERRTGRSGPGAGRPAKLYRRTTDAVSVSLPQRQYDLAGQLLATAIEQSQGSGEPPQEALAREARARGAAAGRDRPGLREALEDCGYEPFEDGSDILLANCPFHDMAQSHVDLVCGMNLNLLEGVLDGVDEIRYRAELDPAPGRCCVRLTAVEAPAQVEESSP